MAYTAKHPEDVNLQGALILKKELFGKCRK